MQDGSDEQVKQMIPEGLPEEIRALYDNTRLAD